MYKSLIVLLVYFSVVYSLEQVISDSTETENVEITNATVLDTIGDSLLILKDGNINIIPLDSFNLQSGMINGNQNTIPYYSETNVLSSTKMNYTADSVVSFSDSADTVKFRVATKNNDAVAVIEIADDNDSIGNFHISSKDMDTTENRLTIGINDSLIRVVVTGGYGSLIYDNFDRADDTLTDPWFTPPWSAGSPLSTVDSQVYSANGHSLYDTTIDGDQFAQIVLTGIAYNGIWLRADNNATADGYRCALLGATSISVSRWVAGAETVIGNAGTQANVGDTLKFYATGDSLFVYINDTLKVSIEDATWSSGYVGLYCQGGYSDYLTFGEYFGVEDTTYDTVNVKSRFISINSASGQVTVNDTGLPSWEPLHMAHESIKLSDLEPGEIVYTDSDTTIRTTGIGFDIADSSFSFIRIGSGSSPITVLNMSDDTNDTLILTSGGKTWKFEPVADQ